MADIVVAAAEGDQTRASALAEALADLGFNAAAQSQAPADVTKSVEEPKVVLTLWSASASAPWLVAQATLALDRKKLISVEIAAGAAPQPFALAPRINLDARDRLVFKQRFEALVGELQKLAPTETKGDAIPGALSKARAALGRRAPAPKGSMHWRRFAAVATAMAALFVIGVGASRFMAAIRSGQVLVSHAAEATPARLVLQPGYGLTETELETLPWRDAAARIGEAQAARIKTDAETGAAFAQTLACLGHMAGAPGFLPSPTAASNFCDLASAQNNRSALYLSWTLRRTMPNATISESVARDRLAQAARLGLTAAQVDYALQIAPDKRSPTEAQAEAGRMLLAAAEAGDARGQFYYARWLRDSPAGPRDPAAAVPFLQRAAGAGEPEALHLLATFYRDGIGVPRDTAKAQSLYEQAATENYPPSMLNLADMVRANDRSRAADLYSRLACMRDEHEISAMAQRRLHAMEQTAHCS